MKRIVVCLTSGMVALLPFLTLSPAAAQDTHPGKVFIRAAFVHTATLSSGGSRLQVSGPLKCQGTQVTIRATVSQRISGTWAEGHWQGTCSHTKWKTTVTVVGANHLKLGAAEGCALAVGYVDGKQTDAFQWCSAIQIM
jgi:hypothetical protein